MAKMLEINPLLPNLTFYLNKMEKAFSSLISVCIIFDYHIIKMTESPKQ